MKKITATAMQTMVCIFRKLNTRKGQIKIKRILLAVGLVLVTVGILVTIRIILIGFDEPVSRPQNQYEHAAVAADAAECSIIGRDILRAGGSAADAGIASLICINLFSAYSSGIGGGGFFLYFDKATENYTFFNGREVAPLAATENMYDTYPENSIKGGLAIGVPGEICAMWDLHQRYGKLPWANLFAPTIQWATQGFEVTSALAEAVKVKSEDILDDPNLSEVFAKPGCLDGGEVENAEDCLVVAGDVMTRPKLAVTLGKLAQGGRDTFYTGELAKDILADIEEYGGIITADDLAGYKTSIKVPLKFDVADWKAVSVNPPGSGPVLALILNILEGYGFTPDSISTIDDSVLTYHRLIEAFKFAYAKRSALGDEDFIDVEELVSELISQSFADKIRREEIDDDMTYGYEYYDPAFLNVEDHGTTHLSIIDAQGNALAATSTINTYFGAKVRGSRTGILFNNEMDDFSQPNEGNFYMIPPSPSNFIVPGKRPMSSMSPTILSDVNGHICMVVGAAGGSKITTSVATTILRNKWLGFNIADAIEGYRLHHQLVPPTITYEDGFNQEILTRLAQDKGHNVTKTTGLSVVQGISLLEDGWYEAHSDSRKGGQPAGY